MHFIDLFEKPTHRFIVALIILFALTGCATFSERCHQACDAIERVGQ